MLNKDGLFHRSNDSFFRAGRPAPTPSSPQPETPPAVQPATPVHAEKDKGDERKEAKLIVGPDIKMKGVEVSDCDTLVVEGRIEATLDARQIQVAQSGTFCGTVAVDIAEIHGRVEGELTVRKQLILHATGRISGKIRYARIKVEEGAELSGEISVLERAPATPALPRHVAPPARITGTQDHVVPAKAGTQEALRA
jgi:cytoskeletal protein CcmA (bactofilin family)